MKRNNYGTFKIIGYIFGASEPIYILSDDAVKYWKDLKNILRRILAYERYYNKRCFE